MKKNQVIPAIVKHKSEELCYIGKNEYTTVVYINWIQ